MRTYREWKSRRLVQFVAIAIVIFAAGDVSAQSAVERGRAIAEEADLRDLGWHDNTSNMQMVLRNRNGDVSTRELTRKVLEVTAEGEGDKSVIVFQAPRDIDGTALLSHTRILEPDDQWLYLPALSRVKRISSSNKSGPFVGSEFAFEDLVSQEVGKYDYSFLREESCDAGNCFVVERYPLYENSGYTKQVVWWDDAEYRVQRIDFYDRKNQLLKTLEYEGYQEFLGEYWRPAKMVMTNHQNGKSTDLVFDAWEFGIGLDESEFTSSRLRRAR